MESKGGIPIQSQRENYEQLENLRGQALQQELQMQQFFQADTQAAIQPHIPTSVDESLDTERVTSLLLRTDALILKALRVPPDSAGGLADYPQLVLNLEEEIRQVENNDQLQDIENRLRRMEVEFNQKSLENLTELVKREQFVRDFATKTVIPVIMALYMLVVVLCFIFFRAEDRLPLFGVPLSVLIAGLIGGVTALFIRYRRVTPSRLTTNDLVWFVTKPVIGTLMGGLAYGGIVAGFFVFQAEIPADTGFWSFWIVAWAVGFSDWFFDTFIVQLLGRITGDEDGDALSEFSQSALLTQAEKRNREFAQLVEERNASLIKSLEDVFARQQSPSTETVISEPHETDERSDSVVAADIPIPENEIMPLNGDETASTEETTPKPPTESIG